MQSTVMPRRYDNDDDEDYEDERRRRRRPGRRTRRRPKNSKALFWILGGVGALLLLGIGVVVVIFFLKGRHSGSGPSDMPGMTAYWSFEDGPGTRIEDHSGRRNHAKLLGGQLGMGGPHGQALILNGSSDQYCDIGSDDDFNFRAGSSFTIAGWYQTFEQAGTIISLRHSKLPTQVEVLIRDGRLLGIVGDDNDRGRQGIVWTRQRNDGGWHHFALVRTDQRVELFLDGLSQGSNVGPDAGGPITTNIRAIGCERLWATTNDNRWGRPGFAGGIDEIYIFARALSAEEIQRLMSR
jgi:large repetitive protein